MLILTYLKNPHKSRQFQAFKSYDLILCRNHSAIFNYNYLLTLITIVFFNYYY